MSFVVKALRLLNWFGWIVAGVWLASLGKWAILGWGIAPILLPTTSISAVVFLPAVIFALPAPYFLNRGYGRVATIFVALAGLYNSAVTALWCACVLSFLLNKADRSSFIPTLLWCYVVATAPLMDLTLEEGAKVDSTVGETPGAMLLLFAEIGFVAVMVILFLSSGLKWLSAVVVFFAFNAFGFMLQSATLLKAETGSSRQSTPANGR